MKKLSVFLVVLMLTSLGYADDINYEKIDSNNIKKTVASVITRADINNLIAQELATKDGLVAERGRINIMIDEVNNNLAILRAAKALTD